MIADVLVESPAVLLLKRLVLFLRNLFFRFLVMYERDQK
tara:strand:- start:449 stop:565 length:117 start_codon:yes stop_codon:yes gene_type:complete